MSTILALAGCAPEKVQVEFPINHPANPQAHEAEFIPPHNPFQTGVAIKEAEPETGSMMKHKLHEQSGKQHRDHNMRMDNQSHSNSDLRKKSGHGKGDNQHKEHNQ